VIVDFVLLALTQFPFTVIEAAMCGPCFCCATCFRRK